MKKIGLITIYGRGHAYNLGGQLQCYAMIRTLEKRECNVKLIINNKYGREHGLTSTLTNNLMYRLKVCACYFFSNPNRKRICKFEKFSKKYISKTKIPFYKGMDYKKLNKKYDCFVVGSDQVWNPNYYDDMFINFLAFTSPEKKIAYAPSIGVSELTVKQQEMFKKYLEDFSCLSCREKAGADILKGITGQEVPVVLDPTLLLTKEEWLKIEHKPKFHKADKYILLYYLGEVTAEYRGYIDDLKDNLNCNIIDLNDKNSLYHSCDPSEFVYLIHNAEIVLTDSFHASVFSTLFEKPFLVFDRCDSQKSMNSRIDSLFEMLDLSDHKYSKRMNTDKIMHPDYTHTKELLEVEREKSNKYLTDALKRK